MRLIGDIKGKFGLTTKQCLVLILALRYNRWFKEKPRKWQEVYHTVRRFQEPFKGVRIQGIYKDLPLSTFNGDGIFTGNHLEAFQEKLLPYALTRVRNATVIILGLENKSLLEPVKYGRRRMMKYAYRLTKEGIVAAQSLEISFVFKDFIVPWEQVSF